MRLWEQAGGQATAPPPLPPGGSVAAIFSGLPRALPAIVRVRPPEGAAHLLCSSVLLTARPRDGSVMSEPAPRRIVGAGGGDELEAVDRVGDAISR